DGDAQVGQGQAGVEGGDGRVVPGGDLAQVDVGQGRAVQAQLVGGDARHVEGRYDAAHHRGELHQLALRKVLRLQRRVGRTEIHGVGLDLGDAAARADRLVVDAVAGGGVVVGRPAGHGREHEGRAGAGDLRRLGGAGEAGGQGEGGQTALQGLEHGNTPEVWGGCRVDPGARPLQAAPVTAPFPEDDSPVTKCAPPGPRLSRSCHAMLKRLSCKPASLCAVPSTGARHMRLTPLAAALAALLAGLTPDHATAQDANPATDTEIAELKAQVAALMNRIGELEARDEAQSAINIDNAEALKAMQAGQPKVETKGGLKVTSADGQYSLQVGGRLHFDGYAFDDDVAGNTGTTEFRRARLTLSGTALGWDYKMEQDF